MWISSDYSTDENERELVYPARELRIEFRMSKTQNVFFEMWDGFIYLIDLNVAVFRAIATLFWVFGWISAT